MCYVARGALDIYYEKGVHGWDILAGSVIVQEAGGVVIDPFATAPGPFDHCIGRVICGNSSVVSKLAPLLAPIPPHLK